MSQSEFTSPTVRIIISPTDFHFAELDDGKFEIFPGVRGGDLGANSGFALGTTGKE